MPDEMIFDGRDFDDLARQLNVAAGVYEREMTPTMFQIGTGVAEVAKQIARTEKQRSIPPTIRALPLPGAVAVRAGGSGTPMALLDEMGNKGAKRSATTFRHPVFGSDVWVKQKKHPFLAPALLANRRETTRRLEAAWERVLRMIEGK